MTNSRLGACEQGAGKSPRPDEVTQAIRRAKAELENAILKAELTNDPLRFAFGGIAAALDAFLVGISAARQPVDAAAIETMTKQAAAAAGDGARREVLRLGRVISRSTSMYVGLIVSITVVVSVSVGILWGRADEAKRSALALQSISGRVRDGSASATAWVELMRDNDVVEALRRCEGRAVWTDPSGRRACAVPLWMEPTPPTTPALTSR